MKINLKKNHIIVCESASESAYIRMLNLFLRENTTTFLNPVNANGIHTVISTAKKAKQSNPGTPVYIWIDGDILKRNEYKIDQKNANLLLKNQYNFEDFLVMHLPEQTVLTWQDICLRHDHFEKPLYSTEYNKLLKESNILPDYKKGAIPDIIEFTSSTFRTLFHNQDNTNIKFKSEFLDDT